MKKKIIIICSIIVAIALLLNIAVLWYDLFGNDQGGGVITKISARAKGTDEIVLNLSYARPTGGYSVRNVPETEGEYIGDGMIDYDGSLGKYRIMVKFGDVSPSMRCSLRLMNNNTIKNSPIKLKASIASPSDHGFVLYIGSDVPISVDPIDRGDLNPLGGIIKIPIKLNQE